MKIVTRAVLLALAACTSKVQPPLTFYITKSGDDSKDCMSQKTACVTLKRALDQVPQPPTMEVVVNTEDGPFVLAMPKPSITYSCPEGSRQESFSTDRGKYFYCRK